MQAGGSRELEARNYLEKHRIMELVNYLTSTLLFFRPEKPREYLISILERLRIAKVTGVAFPFFMDHSNIVSMFEMMDTSHKGTISFVQYREGLKTLGLLDEDEVLQDDGHVITLEKFRSEVKHSEFPNQTQESIINMHSTLIFKKNLFAVFDYLQ
ncbi:EF-hand calcium-binding domain-containing protein 10 isoform X1 [Neovison vison]|uniref:EF-hand calcium-binding domain-containing protein 10 isoform X1 n=1 Tax=Neovison vison TaxID=452646 RepID=UPI001CF01F56|nr:EF-hand calcium-binding domain-containing protein 10 isoform X1 [Neogale vison]